MISESTRSIVILIAALAVAMLQAAAAEPVPNRQEHLSVPIRWCAVRGSPAVEDPAGGGASNTDGILRARHGQASVFVWLPQARISFRSALTTEQRDRAGFPLIDDPHPPKEDGSGGPGLEGDILDPQFDRAQFREINAAIAGCEKAWERMEDQFDTNFAGIIGINIRRFVKPDGTPSQLLGIGTSMHTVPYGTDRCAVPPNRAAYQPFASNNGWVAVTDKRFIRESDPNDSVLAHELGHVLFLGHGNGQDDPVGTPPRTNARYDAFCDRHEDVRAAPATLMVPERPIPGRLTALQAATARAAARVTVGGVILKDGDLQSGYVISDDEVDTVWDVKDPSVDLRSLGIHYNTRKGITILSYRLVGRLPKKANHRFLIFADLDADSKTGGEPAGLGFPTGFQGAELVAEVAVRTHEGETQPRIAPTMWLYQSGKFVKLPPDARIKAAVTPAIVGHTATVIHDVVSIQTPHALVVPRPVEVRFQAVAERIGGELDRLPDHANKGHLIRLTKPVYPVCEPIPPVVRPGSTLRIDASGLVPSRQANVLYNEKLLGSGTTDSQGNVSVQLPVPEHVKDGFYLLVVKEVETALTAHCAVTVDRGITEKIPSGAALR